MELQHIATVGTSQQVIVPQALYKKLRLRRGEYLNVQRHGRRLILEPNILSKSNFDKELKEGVAQSMAEYKAGKGYGPFDTAEDMIRSLHEGVKRIRAERKKAMFSRKQ